MSDEIKISLFKRDGSDIYQMQYRDPVSGRKCRKTTGTNKKREAERMAGEWEKRLRAGLDWGSGRLEWRQFRERFESEYLEGLAPKSMEKASSILDSFEDKIEPQRLRDVNESTLSKYQKQLRRLGRKPATIKGHLAYIRSALSWALTNKLIDKLPTFPKTQRAKKMDVMKGRPVTAEEYERMLMAIGQVITKPNRSMKREPPVADEARIPSWEKLLTGLWLSGLRLGEALELHWSDKTKFRVDLSMRFPMFRIPAESEKGNRDRILPMTPDFAEFLLETPERQRKGFVFNPLPLLATNGKTAKQPPRMQVNAVGKLIGRIRKAANVVVDWKDPKPGAENQKPKAVYASAHDYRRSFGERWAERVMSKVLMELMRHASIETTMRYYVGQNAERTAGLLWSEFGNKSAKSKKSKLRREH